MSIRNDEELIRAIIEAIESNQIQEARKYLSDRPDLIKYDEGVGGWLDSAVDCGHREMAEMLIKLGCDVNSVNDLGTPLGTALTADRPDMVRLLLERGAKVSSQERDVLTPMVGGKKHSLEMIRLLDQYGADLHEVFVNEHHGEQMNALFLAMSYGLDDVADYLRSRGCELPDQPARVGSPGKLSRFLFWRKQND